MAEQNNTQEKKDLKKDHLPPADESFADVEYGDGFPQDDTGETGDINLSDISRPYDSGLPRKKAPLTGGSNEKH